MCYSEVLQSCRDVWTEKSYSPDGRKHLIVQCLLLSANYQRRHTFLQPVRTLCVVVEVAVASLRVGGVDAQLSEGGGQVPRAVPPAQGRGSGVARLVLVERRGQRGGEVQTGQVGQRAAGVEGRRDAVSRRGRLLRGRKDTEGRRTRLRSYKHPQK